MRRLNKMANGEDIIKDSEYPIEITNAVAHAINTYNLSVTAVTSAHSGITQSYIKRKGGYKLFAECFPDNKKRLYLILRKNVLKDVEELSIPVDSLELINEEYDIYSIPPEIYLDKELFPKLFKLSYDAI